MYFWHLGKFSVRDKRKTFKYLSSCCFRYERVRSYKKKAGWIIVNAQIWHCNQLPGNARISSNLLLLLLGKHVSDKIPPNCNFRACPGAVKVEMKSEPPKKDPPSNSDWNPSWSLVLHLMRDFKYALTHFNNRQIYQIFDRSLSFTRSSSTRA